MAAARGVTRLSPPSLAARITRDSGSSFYYAFRILPAEKRRAIYALYSFCRVVDDCVDEEGGERAAGLDHWLEEVRRCFEGQPQTELGRELAAALARFPMPLRSFEDIVAGCRMDLTERRYATFEDLRLYCERVASAVGLLSIEIFGYRDPQAREYARELGIALQLTNILRDVASDAARGRLYLPLEDLQRFQVAEAEVLEGAARPVQRAELSALLAFQGERARRHYARAADLLPEVDRRSLLSAEVMAAVYRETLERLARRDYPIGGPRVRLSRPSKLWITARTVLRGRA